MDPLEALIYVLLGLGTLSLGLVFIMIPLRLVIYVVVWVAMWVAGRAHQFHRKVWW